MTDDYRKIYADAIAHYGAQNQMIVAIEELSEVQKEVCKYLRGQGNAGHLAEEIADATIMLEQLTIIFGIRSRVGEFVDQKTKRLKERMDKNSEEGTHDNR